MPIILLVTVVGGMGYAWNQLYQELHHRFATDWQSFSKPKFPYKSVELTTSDKLKIYGWYIPVNNPKAVVILLHGFGAEKGRATFLETANILHDVGYSTFLLEMRGVGQSQGKMETLGVKEWRDAEAAYDYLASLPENKNKKIGFLGESMGAATAIVTTGKTGKGDFVIASAPFASYSRLFSFQTRSRELPAWFTPFVQVAAIFELGADYDQSSPDRYIAKIHIPIFIAWSTKDEMIGQNQGQNLYQLAKEPKQGWEFETGHQIIDEAGDNFNQKMFQFLEKYGQSE